MSRFTDWNCPVCYDKFAETDDVVVCPECGTPHHRDCFSEVGTCANNAFHGASSIDKIFDQLKSTQLRQEIKEEEDFKKRDIFGVSRAELSAFMSLERGSEAYKVRIENAGKINPNIFAGLLRPFYQFYKGMRLFGIIAFIPIFYIQFMPFMYTGGAEEFFSLFWGSRERFNAASSIISTVVTLLILLFNDYFYIRHCASKIKQIRYVFSDEEQQRLDGEYYDILRAVGTPRILRAITEPVLVVFAFALIVSLFSSEFQLNDLIANFSS
ncbi:MAG: hypothetical protein FWF82_06075 [Oscillospiraceae bacterium]|nr:hypothetical protein [Oscillospiraceae bacterium]